MSHMLSRAVLGASLLASGLLAASAAQACSGITCSGGNLRSNVTGGTYGTPAANVGKPSGGVTATRPRDGVVAAPATNPGKVGYGHGGVVSAGAGNGTNQLPKGAAVQVSPPANMRR